MITVGQLYRMQVFQQDVFISSNVVCKSVCICVHQTTFYLCHSCPIGGYAVNINFVLYPPSQTLAQSLYQYIGQNVCRLLDTSRNNGGVVKIRTNSLHVAHSPPAVSTPFHIHLLPSCYQHPISLSWPSGQQLSRFTIETENKLLNSLWKKCSISLLQHLCGTHIYVTRVIGIVNRSMFTSALSVR